MIIPSNTLIEIHTDNGGLASGRTWGKTQVIQASDGLSICGGVTLRDDRSGEAGITIHAGRIARVEIL